MLFPLEPATRPPGRERRPLPPGVVRLRLLLAYRGGAFHGVALQRSHRTVGGVLLDAIRTVTRQEHRPVFVVAGRTDAGVHAWGQVVHVDIVRPRLLDLAKVKRSLNAMLNPNIVVRRVDVAPDGFHARYSALHRRYQYTVVNRVDPDPFRDDFVWHVPAPLDRSSLLLACDPLLGTHDFSAFCRVPKGEPDASMIRTLTDAVWVELDDGVLRFDVQATSFCQQMVRSIVGIMIEIGLGKRSAGEVMGVLAAQDRATASPTAPAKGLCLWEVGYEACFAW